MVIRDLLQSIRPKERTHLRLKRFGKKPIYVMIAVIGKNKSAIFYVFFKIGALHGIKLYQLVPAYISEGIVKYFVTAQRHHFLFRFNRYSSILYQGIENVGRHPLVGVPITRMITKTGERKFFSYRHYS